MLNKKTVAVAIAAALSTSALAAPAVASVNLDSSADQIRTYALEAISPSQIVNGRVTIDDSESSTVPAPIGGNDVLNFVTTLGFTIGAGTTKYVRIDLENAVFSGSANNPTVTSTQACPNPTVTSTCNVSVTTSAGGGDGDTFAIFEIAATAAQDIEPGAVVEFDPSGFDILVDGTIAGLQYRLYETAVAAANPTAASSLTLKTRSKQFAQVISAATGDYSDANNEVATVASDFEEFRASTLGGDTTNGALGEIDAAQLIGASGAYNTDSSALSPADLLADGPYSLRLVGNRSFGTFTLESGATDCASGATTATFNATTGTLSTTLTASQIAASTHLICVSVDGNTQILKGGYSLELTGASANAQAVVNTIGTISYDTTSIEVPYLTTFPDYNQRLYIVNSGNTDAAYSISFVTEAGVTATAGTAATGTVPAGEMIALRAVDVVTLVGRTRTSAVIEVEAVDANIQAATQTVNLSDGTTDTVVLNANSITSPAPATQQ